MNLGDQVKHERFGVGSVEYDKGVTVIVRFKHGIEECEKTALQQLLGPLQALELREWHNPLQVITRIQAEAIESVNDAWGVFSPSRIALLPHQLWVCRRVLEKWPARWLVADDVGLGKTIEAGLILWPLLAKGTVKRLLIICPASLVEQWQYRLRTMFDIRIHQYVTEADTAKTDFWGTHDQVVASLETLRLDKEGKQEDRQKRILSAPPWDMLIVDEAHHLNADEDAGPTLGFKFTKQLIEKRLVTSVVFFTGTPHRGKNYGFLSILSILRPDLFDPGDSFFEQLSKLPMVMIRNNKQSVTDLKGNKLFQPPIVNSETFTYSDKEKRFYDKLTEFIITGKAYASSLGSTEGRAVMLVLIAIQKLASSSVAAIRKSLKGRFERIIERRKKLEKLKEAVGDKSRALLQQYVKFEQTNNADEINKLEETIVQLSAMLKLMENEEQKLQELVTAADEIASETKIEKIVSTVENQFANRSILFFTEYKATQSLLMSALIKEFGNDCVAFINGEGKADDVIDSSGNIISLFEDRATAAERFNRGKVRFLISTEAGGEGIDLQENCHTLIHVDLPWNPMRLHQRVGRINRYGQTKQVEVITLRNPDTVESLIWEKLNAKINNIMMAFTQIMEEPEDLLQLVLGMTSPSLFREIFSEAENVPKEAFFDWFDTKTANFGGKDVIETVKEIVGHCAKFDFQEVSSQIPKLDLPSLKPFLLSMLILNNRRAREDENGLSFKTPEDWLNDVGIRNSYDGMIFDRQSRSKDAAQKVLGVGHKIVSQALKQAKSFSASLASIPENVLEHPIMLFRVYDQITGREGSVSTILAGVETLSMKNGNYNFLKDWEVLEKLNRIADSRDTRKLKTLLSNPDEIEAISSSINHAITFMDKNLNGLLHPFKLPKAELFAVLWPFSGVENIPETVDDHLDADEGTIVMKAL